MDFFQFLQNSKDSVDISKTSNKTVKKPHEQNQQTFTNTNIDTNLNNQEVEVYKNINKGDFVKIIGVKDSVLNFYKGYIGEVRDYKRDKDSAMILLHPITYQTIIKFPLHHFIKIDPFRKSN
jgi:hypothetical protein